MEKRFDNRGFARLEVKLLSEFEFCSEKNHYTAKAQVSVGGQKVEVVLTRNPVYLLGKNGKPYKVWDTEFVDDAQLNEMAYEVGTELDWWQVLSAYEDWLKERMPEEE